MKLTIGKLTFVLILLICIINRILYQIKYNEFPFFDGGPIKHGVWTFITGLSMTITWLVLIITIIFIIVEYWNKPIK